MTPRELEVAADWLRGLDVRGITVSLRGGKRLELRPASAYKQMSDAEMIVLRHHRDQIKQLVASGAWQSMAPPAAKAAPDNRDAQLKESNLVAWRLLHYGDVEEVERRHVEATKEMYASLRRHGRANY